MDLSIIIVTYNSENDIERCIDSIIENTVGLEYEVVVVDNSSKDSTKEIVKKLSDKYTNIRLIHAENRGFNAGNNIGIKQSTGEFIALLNPDTILLNNAFKIIIENMNKHKKIGPCGATLYNEHYELTMSHGCFPGWKETLTRTFKLRDYRTYYLANTLKDEMKVEYPSGAVFVFKRELIEEVGLMDEEYFLYFDETDYAFRFKKMGLNSYLFTKAKVIHAQGNSTNGVSEFAREKFFESFVRYLNKNNCIFERYLIVIIKLTEHVIKYLISKLIQKDLSMLDNYKGEIKFYSRILKKLEWR